MKKQTDEALRLAQELAGFLAEGMARAERAANDPSAALEVAQATTLKATMQARQIARLLSDTTDRRSA